ncbi:MAG: hypothetical protein ISQ34_01195 [Rickettsiales bacterium]|nr:hypothetical protein [Rickettsiales bacterium]
MQNELSLLSGELAKMLEAGLERQINSSIRYSPFRLFYHLFKKKNPQTIQRVRDMLIADIETSLREIQGFDATIFVQGGEFSDSGKLLRKRAYNLGIRILKKLGVKMAFRVVKDAPLQNRLYNFVLNQIKTKADDICENVKYG